MARFSLRDCSTKRRFVTKAYWLNCWFALIWLYFRGRIVSLRFRRPYHFIGVTKKGNFIHFRTTEKHDTCLPFWFEGRIEVLERRRQKKSESIKVGII